MGVCLCIENEAIMFKKMKFLLAATSVATLVACGGGGGGGGVTELTFPMGSYQQANYIGNSFEVYGDLRGTVSTDTVTNGLYTAVVRDYGLKGTNVTFETFLAIPVNEGRTYSSRVFNGGRLADSTQTATTYYKQVDENYIGFNQVGAYGVVTQLNQFPSTVKVGDSGLRHITKIYSDSTKATQIATSTSSWQILDVVQNSSTKVTALVEYTLISTDTASVRQSQTISNSYLTYDTVNGASFKRVSSVRTDFYGAIKENWTITWR